MKGLVFALAAWVAMALPAAAQFGAPGGGAFGSPGIYAAPEAASGAIGAGAAGGAANQQQCTTTYAGRDGARTTCAPGRAEPPKR